MSNSHAATPACRGSTSLSATDDLSLISGDTGGAEGITRCSDGFDGLILGGAEL